MNPALQLGACLLAVALVAGCSRETPPSTGAASTTAAADTAPLPTLAPIGDYRLLEVHLGRTVDAEGRVSEALDAFAPADTLHLSVVGSATSTALTLSVRWLDAAGTVIATSEQALPAGQASVASFQLKHPAGWPSGNYRVELAVNGQAIDHRAYVIH